MFKTRLELKQAKTINPLKAKAKSWKMNGIDLGELNLQQIQVNLAVFIECYVWYTTVQV